MSKYVNAYSTVREEVPWPAGIAHSGPIHSRTVASGGGRHPVIASPYEGDDAAEMQDHLEGFYRYAVSQGMERAGSYNSLIHSTAQHIATTRRQYVFERGDDFQPSDLAEFRDWAAASNSVFFIQGDNRVRDAAGADLLDPATVQRDSSYTAPQHPEARRRRDRIRGNLWDEGIKIAPTLPPVVSESEIILRPPQQLVERATALFVTAEVATHVLDNRAVDVEHLRTVAPVGFDSNTDAESAFISKAEAESPNYSAHTKQDAVHFGWGFVSAELLGWAANQFDADVTTIEPAKVDRLREWLLPGPQAVEFRSLAEICDAYEYTFSMRWLAVEEGLAQERQSSPELHLQPMQHSILLERHHAFAWMTTPRSSWDEVDLST